VLANSVNQRLTLGIFLHIDIQQCHSVIAKYGKQQTTLTAQMFKRMKIQSLMQFGQAKLLHK